MDAGLPRVEFEAHGRIASAVAKRRENRASSGRNQRIPAAQPPFHRLGRLKPDRLLGHEAVMRHIVSESDPLPGMAPSDEAARLLLSHMLTSAGDGSGLHLFITHDSVITATVSRLQGIPHGPSDWPCFLEGALFWRTEKGVLVVYREAVFLIRLTDTESRANTTCIFS